MPLDFTPSRRLSCGIVILNPDRELLLCHVTGQNHWDLPKGGMDASETTIEAALRETREETGLSLDAEARAERLLDLGRLRYTGKKDLYLFAVLMPRFDLAPLHCASLFEDRPSGRRLPEMDGYAWVRFDRITERCTPKMVAVLTTALDLDRLLDTLIAHDRAVLTA